jgi:hypothetical protein
VVAGVPDKTNLVELSRRGVATPQVKRAKIFT